MLHLHPTAFLLIVEQLAELFWLHFERHRNATPHPLMSNVSAPTFITLSGCWVPHVHLELRGLLQTERASNLVPHLDERN